MKVCILGLADHLKSLNQNKFDSKKRFKKLFGDLIDLDEVEWVNLIGQDVKPGAFVNRRILRLWRDRLDYRIPKDVDLFVVLGRHAAVWGISELTRLQPQARIIDLPHPSGYNRTWNDPGAVLYHRARLILAIEGVKGCLKNLP